MSFHHVGFSEKPSLEWGQDTMNPPPLTPSELLNALMDEIRLCISERISICTTLAFLFLILVQRIAYSKGWKEGQKQGVSRGT